MTINEYQKAAMRTISGVAGATKDNQLINGAMGLCGESGEFMDLLKKHAFHGHTLDKEHMAKELGDIACCWPDIRTDRTYKEDNRVAWEIWSVAL